MTSQLGARPWVCFRKFFGNKWFVNVERNYRGKWGDFSIYWTIQGVVKLVFARCISTLIRFCSVKISYAGLDCWRHSVVRIFTSEQCQQTWMSTQWRRFLGFEIPRCWTNPWSSGPWCFCPAEKSSGDCGGEKSNGWMSECMIEWVSECLRAWMDGWVSARVSEWVSPWVRECVSFTRSKYRASRYKVQIHHFSSNDDNDLSTARFRSCAP